MTVKNTILLILCVLADFSLICVSAFGVMAAPTLIAKAVFVTLIAFAFAEIIGLMIVYIINTVTIELQAKCRVEMPEPKYDIVITDATHQVQ